MALAHFQRPVQDALGNLIPSGYATVRRETAGAPLGVPYSDRAGASALANPIPWSNGVLDFYMTGGAYRIQGLGAGGETFDWRYVGIGTGSEIDASVLLGAAFNYQFESTTSAPPSSGCIRANHATWASATEVYIHETNSAGSDAASQLAQLAADDSILITMPDGTQAHAVVTSNTDSGAYRTLGISSPGGDAPAVGNVALHLGLKGQDGTMASVVAGEGIDVDETDPANPVVSAEAATTTNAGIGEIATASEFRTGNDTARFLGVAETWAGALSFGLTDAATIDVNLASFLTLAHCALGGNRTLDFTNLKEGQHFVLEFTATGSTRTLTMDAIAKLWNGVEVGPYSITTSQTLFVCGFVPEDGASVEISAIGRRAT